MNDSTEKFIEEVWGYYAKHARNDLPWRKPELSGNFDPYKILVSEIMLQQTQVSRVILKYQEWLVRFPDVATLASAPLSEILTVWIGLGYNRRAKFLHESAKQIVARYKGAVPSTQAELTGLPGVGANTAGAVLAYAYNLPTIFIETNIRAVYIYHFFKEASEVSDKELLPVITGTLDTENPREWYWALMDYGSYIKSKKGNYSRFSKHHTRQSTFAGSKRQIRGAVLRALTNQKIMSTEEMSNITEDSRLSAVLTDLEHEGLIITTNKGFSLAQ